MNWDSFSSDQDWLREGFDYNKINLISELRIKTLLPLRAHRENFFSELALRSVGVNPLRFHY